MMKRPKEMIVYLPIEQEKTEWVDWNGKPSYQYVVKIPYWFGRAYSRNNIKLLKCVFQDKVPCGYDRIKEEGDIEKKYFKENWIKKSRKMRKLNTNYIKFIPLSKQNKYEQHSVESVH